MINYLHEPSDHLNFDDLPFVLTKIIFFFIEPSTPYWKEVGLQGANERTRTRMRGIHRAASTDPGKISMSKLVIIIILLED